MIGRNEKPGLFSRLFIGLFVRKGKLVLGGLGCWHQLKFHNLHPRIGGNSSWCELRRTGTLGVPDSLRAPQNGWKTNGRGQRIWGQLGKLRGLSITLPLFTLPIEHLPAALTHGNQSRVRIQASLVTCSTTSLRSPATCTPAELQHISS